MDDDHAKSQSSGRPRSSGISPVEVKVYLLELFFIHAYTGIPYLYMQVDAVVVGYRRDVHIYAALICKLESVRDKVPQYLLELGDIRAHDRRYRSVYVNDKFKFALQIRGEFIYKIVKDR